MFQWFRSMGEASNGFNQWSPFVLLRPYVYLAVSRFLRLKSCKGGSESCNEYNVVHYLFVLEPPMRCQTFCLWTCSFWLEAIDILFTCYKNWSMYSPTCVNDRFHKSEQVNMFLLSIETTLTKFTLWGFDYVQSAVNTQNRPPESTYALVYKTVDVMADVISRRRTNSSVLSAVVEVRLETVIVDSAVAVCKFHTLN